MDGKSETIVSPGTLENTAIQLIKGSPQKGDERRVKEVRARIRKKIGLPTVREEGGLDLDTLELQHQLEQTMPVTNIVNSQPPKPR